MKRASHRLIGSGAAAAFAALWLSACSVPLAPGYAVEKESLEVRYVPGSPPHLAVRAAYQLRNVGNAPLSSINVTLPSEKGTGRDNLKVSVDGREITLASAATTSPNEAPDDTIGIPFDPPWPLKQRRNLVISYDLAGSKALGTLAFVGDQGFHFNAAGWLPELHPPKVLLAHGVARPDGTQVHLFVPGGFLALCSGQSVGAKKQGGELEYSFRLRLPDLDPFIVAGRYHEQRVRSAGEDVRFWTFDELSRDAMQHAAERVAATLAFYEANFGPRGKRRSPLWIVQAPEPAEAGLDARSVVRTLPEVVFVAWPGFPQGLAEGDHLLPLDWLVADIWFQDVARPRPPARLLADALSFYAVTGVAEAREGIAARQKAVSEMLRSYDSLSTQAVEKPLLSLSPEDHAQREIARRKLDLFLFALEDQYGRESIRAGIKNMVQFLRGGQYGYDDFRAALESATGKDLAGFFRTWLDEKGIPADFRARYDASAGKNKKAPSGTRRQHPKFEEKNMREIISTDRGPKALGPYSQAIKANGFIFVSGQGAVDPATGKLVEGDTARQTERTLENLKAILEAAGSSLHKAVKATVFLKDMNDFAAMNEVYARFFPQGPPARSTVEVARLPLDLRVEIEMIALV